MLPLLASSSSECFAFRAEHNGNYLHTVYRKKAGGGRIEPTAESVVASARTRFLVELSEVHEGLVHVRCCHNKKYWATESPANKEGDIIVTVNEPEDDLSEMTCTLFEPITETGKDNCIRFFHPTLAKYACISFNGKQPYLELRFKEEIEEDSSCIFSVIGLSRQKELPKHVAFKGDNDKFVGTKFTPKSGTAGLLAKGFDYLTDEDFGQKLVNHFGVPLQQFHTKDIGDRSVILTVFTNDDGTVRIRSNNMGLFWRRAKDDWILADSSDQDCKDPDTLFEVIRGDGFIALRNLGNNKICRRLDAHAKWFDLAEKTTSLCAHEDSISKWARLTLAEPVVSREITDVQFQIDEARVYNSEILNMFTEHRTNGTSSAMKATFSFVQKIEIESKWETSVSSKIGVDVSIKAGTAGEIPFIVGGEVTLSTEFTSAHGDTKTEGDKQETTVAQEFTVKPMTVATVKFVATRSCCDVPYSYKQTVVLTTGEKVETTHDDGIYTGANNYDFHVIFTESEYKAPRSYKLSGTK